LIFALRNRSELHFYIHERLRSKRPGFRSFLRLPGTRLQTPTLIGCMLLKSLLFSVAAFCSEDDDYDLILKSLSSRRSFLPLTSARGLGDWRPGLIRRCGLAAEP